MVGYTQEIWFARMTRAFSPLLAGDHDADDVDENHEDDEDGHMDIWSYGG